MFQTTARSPKGRSVLGLLELIYHSIVRDMRKSHSNAFIGLLMAMSSAVIFVLAFYLMFTVLGLRNSAVRGDFMLYVMSGIFLFLTHTKALGAVLGAEGPTSQMMKHAPMNTMIAIIAAAISCLYIQTLSMVTIIFFYHSFFNPVEFADPVGAFGMYLMAWFTGCAVGLVFLAAKPWLPGLVTVLSSIYMRMNMIASGKMFLANTLPYYMLKMFDWNPLFHAIDQARGFTFINYNPHFSSISYPLYVGLALVMIGLMGEFFTRQHASESWGAGK